MAECRSQHFGTEARPAHAEQDRIGETVALYLFGESRVARDLFVIDAIEPAKPAILIGAGPKRLVAQPQLSDIAVHAPFFGDGFRLFLQLVAEREVLLIDLFAENFDALLGDGGEELVGGVGEQPHALVEKLVGNAFERDAGPFECAQHALRVRRILQQAVAQFAVVAKRVDRCDRHGVDGIGADQLFDIEYVAISLVLGAGRRPQQPLWLGAVGFERVPARPGKQAQIALIGELGIGDGDLALERFEPFLFVRVIGARDLFVEQFVDRGVDAADKEARYAGDARRIAAFGGERLEAGQIGLDDLLIGLLREQQRNVDVDAVGDQVVDGRHAFGRRRHFDHQVFAIDGMPQALGFGDGALGVFGEIRRDFDADKAVGAVRCIEYRAEHIGRALDILDSKLFKNLAGRPILLFEDLRHRVVIFIGMADGVLEDRGVRRHAAQAVLVAELLEAAFGDEAAREKIEPNRLAVVLERFQSIHRPPFLAMRYLAIRSSAVIPYQESNRILSRKRPCCHSSDARARMQSPDAGKRLRAEPVPMNA